MSSVTHDASSPARAVTDDVPRPSAAVRRDPGHEAFLTLRLAFSVAPIAFGLDKFFNVMTDWPKYLAPWVDDLLPGSAQDVMYVVGGVEILAGVLVALKPRYGAPLVAAWLAGIIVNLLSFSGWYDVALRDFGLLLAAVTLARLAVRYDPPLGRRGSRGAPGPDGRTTHAH